MTPLPASKASSSNGDTFSLSAGALGTIICLCIITIAVVGSYFAWRYFKRKRSGFPVLPPPPPPPPLPRPLRASLAASAAAAARAAAEDAHYTTQRARAENDPRVDAGPREDRYGDGHDRTDDGYDDRYDDGRAWRGGYDDDDDGYEPRARRGGYYRAEEDGEYGYEDEGDREHTYRHGDVNRRNGGYTEHDYDEYDDAEPPRRGGAGRPAAEGWGGGAGDSRGSFGALGARRGPLRSARR
jgi:hypothetical protein